MIDSHALQNRCVEIVDVHGVLYHVVTKVIRGTKLYPTANTASRHPNRKTLGMMVPTIVFFAQSSLAINGSAKLTSPYDQRGIQKTSLFQIL